MSSTRNTGSDDLLSGVNLETLKRNEAATRRIGQLEADKKPAAIVERLLSGNTQAVLDGSNMALTATLPLTISAAKREALQNSTRYHISEDIPVDIYLALRREYQRRINETLFDNSKKKITGSQLDIMHQGITYESLGEFIGKSKDKELKHFLKKIPDSVRSDIEEMPLCVFVAMNVGHSVSTISLLSSNPDNSELAQNTNELKLIDLSGIDFQNQKVIDYFFPKDKTGRPVCNEARLQKVISGLMARQKQVCEDNKIDVVVGMPRGLASFLTNLTVQRGPDAAQNVKDVYWDAYFKMVSESPNIKFYINPIFQLSEEKEAALRVKYPSSGNLVMLRNVDVRSLAITLNDREYEKEKVDPSYKRKIIGYDNAGDQMGLLNETKLGRHWRVKGEGSTVGQDEFTNATMLAGITTKAADRHNILLAGSRLDSRLTAASAAAVSSSSSSSSSSGADINAVINPYGGTALSTAVVNTDIASVRRLLADPVIQIDKQDYKGNTPLIWALAKNRPDIAIALIEHGANLNEKDPRTNVTIKDQISQFAKVDSANWKSVEIAMNRKISFDLAKKSHVDDNLMSPVSPTSSFAKIIHATQSAAASSIAAANTSTPSSDEPARLARQRANAQLSKPLTHAVAISEVASPTSKKPASLKEASARAPSLFGGHRSTQAKPKTEDSNLSPSSPRKK